jgi:2-polyprenyl-6-methoxyphenol hydroxylase-like FAD-dependent oxidoreductase
LSPDPCVLVAGGGPVGLVAALALAESGVAVRLFEAEPDIAEDLRASTFHPPTLDMLERFGITAELVAQGLVCPSWQVRMHPSGARAVFDLSMLAGETRHPYRLQCEQWKLSRAALARLRAHPNAEVNFGARVVDVAQDDQGVAVAAGGARVTGRFLVAADGARSAIRGALGIGFEGSTYPETTLLCATTFPFHEHLEGLSHVNYCWKADGTFSLLRLPGLWRCSFYPRPGESVEDALTDESLQVQLREIVSGAESPPILARRPYRIHRRIAERYRAGRVFLAGDAAHLNSPSGGMGMNGGVHDALNVADKLARVWQGESETLLDRYEAERRPIALEEIIAQADANRARMQERDPARRRELLAGLQAIAADPARCREHLLRTSMIAGLRSAAAG